MWSSRNTPNVWTKFWSSCVRHVQMDIMLPPPTSDARTSISAKIEKEENSWVSLSPFEGLLWLIFVFKGISCETSWGHYTCTGFSAFPQFHSFFVSSSSTYPWRLFMLHCCHRFDSLSHTTQRYAQQQQQRLHLDGSWISIFQSPALSSRAKLFYYDEKECTWGHAGRKTQRDGNDWSRVVRAGGRIMMMMMIERRNFNGISGIQS